MYIYICIYIYIYIYILHIYIYIYINSKFDFFTVLSADTADTVLNIEIQ